jgi:hypothetical protein
LIRGFVARLFGREKDNDQPDQRLVAFARGMALGALVGAAIAGSSIWSRARRLRR